MLASQPSVSIDTETTQTDSRAQLAGLADAVHHLAQQFLVGYGVAGAEALALYALAAEAFDLVRGHRAEVIGQRIVRLELRAVYE